MPDCSVKFNCKHAWDCDWCRAYSDYSPYDKKILSPAQEERIAQRKEEKKELKASEKSKRGKRNKRNSYKSEKGQEHKYQRWGFKAERVILSGALKNISDNLRNDVHVWILDKRREEENKRGMGFEPKYKITEGDMALMVGDSFVMMNEDLYHGLLLGIVPDTKPHPDTGMKFVHDAFKQSGADIVSLRQHRRQKCVYAITIPFWEELINGTNDGK